MWVHYGGYAFGRTSTAKKGAHIYRHGY